MVLVFVYPESVWYVYLIECEDDSIYTGITDNLERRLNEHKAGRGGHYTYSHGAIEILYSENFETKSEALKRESQIKGWRREKKLNLIKFGKLVL